LIEISLSTVPAADVAGALSPEQPLKPVNIEPAETVAPVAMMPLIKLRRDNLADADSAIFAGSIS
jgi:hypothetical protein